MRKAGFQQSCESPIRSAVLNETVFRHSKGFCICIRETDSALAVYSRNAKAVLRADCFTSGSITDMSVCYSSVTAFVELNFPGKDKDTLLVAQDLVISSFGGKSTSSNWGGGVFYQNRETLKYDRMSKVSTYIIIDCM